MLTMPKLISALMIGFIAWIASGLVMEVMPRETDFGWFVPLSVVVGLACGWMILGRRATGRLGLSIAASIGLTAVLGMVFWTLFLVSFNEILRLSLEGRFDGAVAALQALVPVMGDYGQYLVETDTILLLAIGGPVAGILADAAARRWA